LPQSLQLYNISTLQLSNKKLVLRPNDLAQHSVPERRSITHRGEPQGKEKMTLYAQHDNTKL